jgi:NAD(P)-dependent dehydrogenase (short-subunit alcohol dehydrogenase family)
LHRFSENSIPRQRRRQSASARAGDRRRRPGRAGDRAGAGGDGRGDRLPPLGARRLAQQAARALGGLDVLVNSAAIFDRTPFATTTVASYDRLLGLNLRAAFFCSQAAAAVMRRGGHIINIGDAGTAGPRPNYIPYTLAKVGIERPGAEGRRRRERDELSGVRTTTGRCGRRPSCAGSHPATRSA